MEEEEEKHPIQNKLYICPFPKCDLIPEILNVYSDTGKIILKCDNGHICELDILEYFQILEGKIKKSNLDINKYDDYKYETNESSDINTIKEKEKEIVNIIKLNELALALNNINPKNFTFNQNIINIGEYFEEENCRSKEIDDIIKEEIFEKREEENKAINELKLNYSIHINNKIEFLTLKGEKEDNKFKWLGNRGFELISQIRFKNLIELNLARNGIYDIEPLNNMFLSHLEIINFSDNYTEDISPIANLLSNKLSEIYLQNNRIQDLSPFSHSKFPLLEICRIDGNKIPFENNDFKDILKKFVKIIYFKITNWNDFTLKYGLYKDYDQNVSEKLDLGSRKEEKILIDLFPLIIFPNKLKNLILSDNKLRDVSLLNKMPLYHLEYLDLSMNFIANVKFLNKMSRKCKNLISLFLEDNKIIDISPLIIYKFDENKNVLIFSNLRVLTLKNNKLDKSDKITKDILVKLNKIDGLNMDFDIKDFLIPKEDN